ncbi:bifunctional RNase H/acid phosphatase [Delftia tsuruhatensis]|uniref:ribonuclease HI family protein n=1 Tax=Delftia tsuruhatensis TaxID=180282 RepID=UPI001E6EF53D|nr:ribonuclease HI family protein [Delftia tsuruhatensis]CAB5722629.1 bifunctional RNase H/acid phosphatase [Delftia tsuruhatensis]CAC9680952.1 bifunctional RNase H/acid phosphatase [Delftia tsuruhatensis]
MPPVPNDTLPSFADTGLWTASIDGSSLPNPGAMAIGAVILAPDGSRHVLSQALHAQGCNNEAELRALIAVLRRLRGLHAARVSISTDSSILVEQLASVRRTPRPILRLAALFEEARTMLQGFEQVQLRWVPRHRNTEADLLARAAFGRAQDGSAV